MQDFLRTRVGHTGEVGTYDSASNSSLPVGEKSVRRDQDYVSTAKNPEDSCNDRIKGEGTTACRGMHVLWRSEDSHSDVGTEAGERQWAWVTIDRFPQKEKS